jgi:hypothetical protein
MQTASTRNNGQTKKNPPPPSSAAAAPTRVEELLLLEPDALQRLYEGAAVPELEEVAGDCKGRMLAWPIVRGPAAQLIRLAGSWDGFPWRGKSFTPLGSDGGEGINRVVSDRWKLFRFTTFVGPSRAGHFDAVQLDYDHADNPFFIRAIKDEIREIAPGLYLGQAYLHLGTNDHLVLYFGLQKP